jgi:hypothetical protein
MRTPLFLSTLFAVSLIGGAALADKPNHTLDAPRSHGDTVDKSYRAPERPVTAREGVRTTATSSHASRPAIDRSASRVNCSEAGAECASSRGGGSAHAAMAESASSASGRSARIPPYLDKILGSDQTNFNEAGMDEGMSIRAANRAWAHAGHRGAAAGAGKAGASLSEQRALDRKENQASTNRTVCNEADACMASSKKSTKEWSYLAVKAGTWQGPEGKEHVRGSETRGSATRATAVKSDASAAADKAATSAAAERGHEHQD